MRPSIEEKCNRKSLIDLVSLNPADQQVKIDYGLSKNN
jgi:hypothetical protein